MLGQEAGPDWGIVMPDQTVTQPSVASAGGGFFSQLPGLFQSFEQARVYDAATRAQVAQINQFANINPAWIIAGVFIVLIALVRR